MPKDYVRLTQPLVRDVKGGPLRPATWRYSWRSLFIKQAGADHPTVETLVLPKPGRSPLEGKDAAVG